MANDNEFLPFLNSWPLLFVVIALLLSYSAHHYIMPHIKEGRNVGVEGPRGG